MNTQTAKLKYVHIAPRKMRLIANLLKGLRVNEAEAQLMVHNQRSVQPILKLLRSAIANAIHNQKLDPERLVVDRIWVDQGPMFKRFLPRAQGRATELQKKTSHVTLVLKEIDKKTPPRFIMIKEEKETKKKKPSVKKSSPIKTDGAKENQKPKEKDGFMRRMFRRKSI